MKDKSLSPIGVFDSGLGGLTVLAELLKALPNEKIIYLGDTARVPYGNKSPQTVIRYSLENTRFLLNKSVKLLIVACNTASAFSIDAIRSAFSVPCIGVIQPGARAAVQKAFSSSVAVIGTSGTIHSRAYPEAIHRLNPDMMVFEKACPLFVPLVEEGWVDNHVTEEVARIYLGHLTGKNIGAMILGCTHYPLLKPVISRVMGPDIMLIDSAEETAYEAKNTLKDFGLLATNGAQGGYQIFVTDLHGQFSKVAGLFLKEHRLPVEQVALDEMV
ncbi:glutamate racemase [bacterium]|nr:glutamate racemase [bacterium]